MEGLKGIALTNCFGDGFGFAIVGGGATALRALSCISFEIVTLGA
jgi:hypothetical protein